MHAAVGQAVASPAFGRLRILLLTVFAALVWLLLSAFASSSSAVASEGTEQDPLLDAVIGTVEEITPVPSVTEPVTTVVEGVIEPVKPVVEPVVREAVAEPVAQATTSTLATTTTIVNELVEPVIEQPVIAETIELVDRIALDAIPPGSTEAPDSDAQPATTPVSATMVLSPTFDHFGTSEAAASGLAHPVTGDAQDAADSIRHSPATPTAPTAPASAPSWTLANGSASLTLVAALSAAGHATAATGTVAALVNFSIPASPTFDNDTSPD